VKKSISLPPFAKGGCRHSGRGIPDIATSFAGRITRHFVPPSFAKEGFGARDLRSIKKTNK